MKILFVSRLYLPHLGGVEVHLKEISAILTRNGHEVTILTLQHDKKLKLEAEYDGVKVVRLPFECSEDKQKTWEAVKECKNLFLEADIVHIHDVFWWVLPVYLQIKNKVFITFHGWETEFPIHINSKIHRLLVSKLAKGSIHVGQFIQKFYWDKPDKVIYGGINPKRFTKSNNGKRDSELIGNKVLEFVFVGRLEEDNDIQMYLEFLKILKNKKIKFNITWVGDGKMAIDCKKFGEVAGFVKNISQYVVKADFVFASSYLSILEAMCLEKIVLSFYSNPLKKDYLESFPGSKNMLVSGAVENMILKLEHVLISRKLQRQMKRDSKEFAQEYTWDKVLGEYKKLWNRSLN